MILILHTPNSIAFMEGFRRIPRVRDIVSFKGKLLEVTTVRIIHNDDKTINCIHAVIISPN